MGAELEHMPAHYQRPDNMDVDVAVHSAALNVAVRAELEAARRAGQAEAMEAQRCDPPSGRESQIRHPADNRMHALSSELQVQQAWSSQTNTALDASLRALR